MPKTAGDIFINIEANVRKMQTDLRLVGVALTAIGAAGAAAFRSVIKVGAEFETAITNAASVTGLTGKAAEEAKKKMSDLARQMGKTTVFSARDCAKAMYDLASKGFDVAKMSAAEFRPILDLAAATQADLTVATETVTATLKVFGLENTEAKRVADVFTKSISMTAATIEKLSTSMVYVGPVAKAAGISLEETTAALGSLYDAGLEGSMAGTALRGILIELLSPSDKLQGILKSLGLTLDDINLKEHSLAEVMRILRDAGMSSAQMFEVFGDRAGPAAEILASTTVEVAKATKELKNLGDEARRIAEFQLNTLESQIKLVKNAVEGLQLELNEHVVPHLKGTSSGVADLVNRLTDWVKVHPDLTANIIEVTAALTAFGLVLGPILILLPQVVASIGLLKVAFVALCGPIGLALVAGGALWLLWDWIDAMLEKHFPELHAWLVWFGDYGVEEHLVKPLDRLARILSPVVVDSVNDVGDAIGFVLVQTDKAIDNLIKKLIYLIDLMSPIAGKAPAAEWLTKAILQIVEPPASTPSYVAGPRYESQGPQQREAARLSGGITININGVSRSPVEIAQEVVRVIERQGLGSRAYAGVVR